MPTYDYICDACGHEFEAYESIKSESQRTCPVCKENKLRRKIGAGAAILFKGSGFYQTDYRSESYKKSAKADQPPDSSSKPDSAKSDSPKNESAKKESARSDSARSDSAKADSPKTDSPKSDTSKATPTGSAT
jgi:putative FmdB family regulatory protein